MFYFIHFTEKSQEQKYLKICLELQRYFLFRSGIKISKGILHGSLSTFGFFRTSLCNILKPTDDMKKITRSLLQPWHRSSTLYLTLF